MKILSVASEIYPLIKTGGLADVAGALPLALKPLGIEMRTLVPGYPAVMQALKKSSPVWHYASLFGGAAALLSGTVDGLELFVLDAPHLYNRGGGPYGDASGVDWPDNWQRYAALSQVGSHIAEGRINPSGRMSFMSMTGRQA